MVGVVKRRGCDHAISDSPILHSHWSVAKFTCEEKEQICYPTSRRSMVNNLSEDNFEKKIYKQGLPSLQPYNSSLIEM